MLTLSKALTSAQAKVYYQKDFSNGAGNYYSQGQTVTGQWQGQLAKEWGLEGEVTAEQYNRLADGQDRLSIQLDSGRRVQLDAAESRHLDYGYAVTSHSSQGQSVDRALLYIDTEQTSALALNSRLAYVAVSRARHEVSIYTNDTEKLAEALSRQTTKSSALEAWQKGEEREHSNQLPQTSLTPVTDQVVKPELTGEPAFNLQP